jgi:two-component system response regulator MtrA
MMPGRGGGGGAYGAPHPEASGGVVVAAGEPQAGASDGSGWSLDHPGGGVEDPGAAQSPEPGRSSAGIRLLESDGAHRVRATPNGRAECHHGRVTRGRVLVVDDDPALAEMLGIVLRTEGFEPSFVADGDRALAAFRSTKPDLVLLDLMLPGTDGVDVCRQIRAESGTPIVMLTARGDTVDVVLGLEVGADDYIVKPFKPKELVARMRARLRRNDGAGAEVLHIGDVTIDVAGHVVSRNDEPIGLTPLEFDLLAALAANPGAVRSREQLMSEVWGWSDASGTRTLDSHVKSLRAKIGATRVRTVHGVGYALEAT